MKYRILESNEVLQEGDRKFNGKTRGWRKICPYYYGWTCERVNPFSIFGRAIKEGVHYGNKENVN